MIPSNFSAARARMESFMTEECEIYRDTPGPGTFNEDTGTTEYPDDTAVWTGPCLLFREQIRQEEGGGEGGRDVRRPDYRLRLPHDTPEILPDDIVKIVSSSMNNVNVGREFYVAETPQRTNSDVTRVVKLQEKVHGVARAVPS